MPALPPDRIPVIVGIGEVTDRPRELQLAQEPIALMANALERAASDATDTNAAALLRSIKGIGPWTAVVILLRGLGRLDVFPANDTSVARNLTLIGAPPLLDVETLLDTLGTERGMLYYHLLLGRLETRGDLPPSP